MENFAREKKKLHVKNINFCARESWFYTREKNEKTAREKNKSWREKSEKWAKKWAWKRKTAREKNQKRPKIGFHGHFFFLRGKDNTAVIMVITHPNV